MFPGCKSEICKAYLILKKVNKNANKNADAKMDGMQNATENAVQWPLLFQHFQRVFPQTFS